MKKFIVNTNKKGWLVPNKRQIKKLYENGQLLIACQERYSDDHLRDEENNNYETDFNPMVINEQNNFIIEVGEPFVLSTKDVLNSEYNELGIMVGGNSVYKIKIVE